MGLLMRGSVENFNPQIHTEAKSLTYLMRKDFALRRKSIDLHAKYTKFQSFMYASGRYNNGAQKGRVKATPNNEISDNAYRVEYEGALFLPAYSYGAVQIGAYYDAGNPSPNMSTVVDVEYVNALTEATVATNVPGSISIKHDPDAEIFGDKFNPNDSITLDPGGANVMFIIQQHPRRSTDGSHYVIDGIFHCNAGEFDEAFVEEGMVFTESGDFFGEGSLRGFQRYKRNKWRINYTSIHRTSVTFTGSSMKQKVVTIYNQDAPGSKSWEFQSVLDNDLIGEIKDELALRYSRSSMDPTGHSWFENYGSNTITNAGFRIESGLTSPVMGEGWIPTISDNFRFDYDCNTGLSIEATEAILMVLSQRSPSGSSGNVFIFVTDKIGHSVIDRSLKKLIGYGNPSANTAAGVATGNIFDVRNGQENKIGFTVNKYEYLGNEFVVIEDEILNHPGLFPTNGGVTGKGHIFVLNSCMLPDGTPNFEMFARSGRNLVRKHEPGMHSLDTGLDNGSIATSGFDGASIHTLREKMALLYDARSCAVIYNTAKWNGGALSAHEKVGASVMYQATQFLW